MAADLEIFYRRYLSRCNDHRFAELGEFVAEDVVVNEEEHGLDTYVAGLWAVVAAFPDYHWELRHLSVEDPWIFAHFTDTGTHQGEFLGVPATGRTVTTQEFSVYRVADGKISEVWVTADNLRVLNQLTG